MCVYYGRIWSVIPFVLCNERERRLKWNMSWHWLCLMNARYIRRHPSTDNPSSCNPAGCQTVNSIFIFTSLALFWCWQYKLFGSKIQLGPFFKPFLNLLNWHPGPWSAFLGLSRGDQVHHGITLMKSVRVQLSLIVQSKICQVVTPPPPQAITLLLPHRVFDITLG